jgi:hypothetical protein
MSLSRLKRYRPVVAVFCSVDGWKIDQTFVTIRHDDAGINRLPNVEEFRKRFPKFHGKFYPLKLIIKKDGFVTLETVYFIELDLLESSLGDFTHSVWKHAEHTMEPCSQMIIDHVKRMPPEDLRSGTHHTDKVTRDFCDSVGDQEIRTPFCWVQASGEDFSDHLQNYDSGLPQ